MVKADLLRLYLARRKHQLVGYSNEVETPVLKVALVAGEPLRNEVGVATFFFGCFYLAESYFGDGGEQVQLYHVGHDEV